VQPLTSLTPTTPALNLVEIVFLILPFEWWLPADRFERLNHYVMAVIYSPLLFIIAFIEMYNARRTWVNRSLGEEDDNMMEEWEDIAHEVGFELEGWSQKVLEMKPNVEVDLCVLEVRELKEQVNNLTLLVKGLLEQQPSPLVSTNGIEANREGE
jgi:hypothetical protein